MKQPWIWENGIAHRGQEAREFIIQHFGHDPKNVLIIAGAGFDPRASCVSRELASTCSNISAAFIREIRSDSNKLLHEQATRQLENLQTLVPASDVISLNIFAEDMAVVGGREAIRAIEKLSLDELTDIVVDFSALSLSVAFPIVSYLVRYIDPNINLHIMLAVDPQIDAAIAPRSGDAVDYIHGFKGGLGLDEMRQTACLWVPQLSFNRHIILDRIHQHLTSLTNGLDVCPLIPFPSKDPYLSDRLIANYHNEFENKWAIGMSSVIYASENNPLDVYRAILRMRDERESVFEALGGSQIVLSPAGGKCSAIGMLLAAVDGNFPVVYVEALSHEADYGTISASESTLPLMTHVWLQGKGVPFSVVNRA